MGAMLILGWTRVVYCRSFVNPVIPNKFAAILEKTPTKQHFTTIAIIDYDLKPSSKPPLLQAAGG